MTNERRTFVKQVQRRRRELLPAHLLIAFLDKAVPSLYSSILAAVAYLQDQQGTEPKVLALALGNQMSELFLTLIEHGALDMAASAANTSTSSTHQGNPEEEEEE